MRAIHPCRPLLETPERRDPNVREAGSLRKSAARSHMSRNERTYRRQESPQQQRSMTMLGTVVALRHLYCRRCADNLACADAQC